MTTKNGHPCFVNFRWCMSLRLAFLDDSPNYVTVNAKSQHSSVTVKNVYAAILLMRLVLGKKPAEHLAETAVTINGDELFRLFKNHNHHATSALRGALGKNAKAAEYRIFLEGWDTKKNRALYRLELDNRKTSIDLINMFTLLRQADRSEWKSTQVWQVIEHWHDDYSKDFMSKIRRRREKRAEMECVVWAREQCEYLERTLSAVFDKYVQCLIAENRLDEARNFVETEWLERLDFIYNQIYDSSQIKRLRVWPHFRKMQILYWQTKDRNQVEDYYQNRKAQFEVSMTAPNVLASLVRHIHKDGWEQPSNLTDPRMLVPSENFDRDAKNWIDDNDLKNHLKNKPPLFGDSKKLEHTISNLDNGKTSQPISVPAQSASERNIFLNSIEREIGRHYDIGPRKSQRLQKRLDLNCQLTISDSFERLVETLTSREVRSRFMKNWDRLLILGEPGSGKSYLLYEIAEELLELARASPDAKVPLPLLLKDWNSTYGSFGKWLKHTIAKKFALYIEARRWVDEGSAILLLDGLDDLELDKREACIAALDEYLQDERANMTRCVITCRQQDYVEGPLFEDSFHQINIEPLTDEQIDNFLSQKGSQYASVVRNHPIKELCRTPLILTVVLESLDSILQEHSHILSELDIYQIYDEVCKDRLRKIADGARNAEFIRTGLMALAIKTKRAGLPLFTGEKFDRKWLDSDFQGKVIEWVNKLLIIFFSLVTLITTWLVGSGMYRDGDVNAPFLAELTAVGVWIGGWWLAIAGTRELLEREGIATVLVNSAWNFGKVDLRRVDWVGTKLQWTAIAGVSSGLIGATVAAVTWLLLAVVFSNFLKILSDTLSTNPLLVSGGLSIGMGSIGMAGALLATGHRRGSELKPIGWLMMGLSSGLVYGILVAFAAPLVGFNQTFGFDQRFPYYPALGAAIASGMATTFCVAFVRGLMEVLYEASTNRGLETLEERSISSLTNNILSFATLVATIVALIAIPLTLVVMLIVRLTNTVPDSSAWYAPLPIIVFLNAIFCFGLGIPLFYGGLEIVEHYLAKRFLSKEENRLLRKLDYFLRVAVQMNVIRRDGKFYKFVHDTMRDYFAEGGWKR